MNVQPVVGGAEGVVAGQIHFTLDLKYMGDGHGAVAPDGLGESAARPLDLVGAGLAAELEGGLHDLVGAAGPHRMAPGLEAAQGGEGYAALGGHAALGRQVQGLPPPREAAGLQGEGGDDGEGVVGLEEAHVLGPRPRDLEGAAGAMGAARRGRGECGGGWDAGAGGGGGGGVTGAGRAPVIFWAPTASPASWAPPATARAAARTAAPPEAQAASTFQASRGRSPAASARRVATFSWPFRQPPIMLPA